ncbi:MAG: SDR family NAD(P)-dependent oxidoreductase [Pseudomonadales bacterium]|nr:SDR family NAD(P)-dependent oxidoreductase [Pseudomonadales bacterium]
MLNSTPHNSQDTEHHQPTHGLLSCQGKVAIVTGGSRGIGVAIAQRLAAAGAHIAVIARSLESKQALNGLPGSLKETVEKINSAGGHAIAIVADLSNPDEDYDAIVAQITQQLGAPSILINNAAANFYHPVAEISDKRFDLMINVNLRAPLKLIQAVLPAMKKKGQGSIVNISSASSRLPIVAPDQGSTGPMLYAATKAALDRMTAGLAQELYKDGIHIHSLAPQSGVLTPASQMYYPDLPKDQFEPLETMAEAVLALCECDPAIASGQVTRSLTLLKHLNRPVYSLDGSMDLTGWQPSDLPAQRLIDPLTLAY